MRISYVKMGLTALAATLLVGGSAKADPVWNYTAEKVQLSGTGPNPAEVATSTIDFNPAIGGGTVSGSGSVIVYTVETNTTASAADALAFDSSFNLPIKIIDLASSGASSDLTAKSSGVVNLGGSLKANKVSKTTFNYIDHSIDTTPLAKLTLGSESTGWFDYVVKGISFTPPGVPTGAGATGSVYVSVTVTPTIPGGGGDPPVDPPPPAQTPEPASLLLAAFGLPLALVARRRLKKTADLA